ncbi:unnamed protein product, partial [Schistosoma margrebowiei]
MFTSDVSEPYEILKRSIFKRGDLIDRQRLDQLFNNIDLQHDSATDMLRRMREVIGLRTFDEDLFKQLFLSKLPQQVQTVLVSFQNNALDELAASADRILEITKSSTTENSTSSKSAKLNDQEVFSHAFSQMIHSSAAQDFIHLEQLFALEVGYKLQKRDDTLKEMDQKHIDETERSIQKRGSEVPETITQLQEDYYLNREVIVSHWDSCISALKWEHRQALRTFVMSYEGYINSLPTNNDHHNLTRMFLKDSSSKTLNSLLKKSSIINNQAISKRTDHIPLSETFTVQLGRQLRTMFNFRLIRLDPSELLTSTKLKVQENQLTIFLTKSLLDDDWLAERMNNALNIYSNNLNGLMILVDKRINSFRGIKKLLADACEQSTELHFPEFGSQLESIQETVNRLGSRQLTELNGESKLRNNDLCSGISTGFQIRACLVMQFDDLRNVCPIHFHRLFLISSSAGSWNTVLALPILAFTSASEPPCSSMMLP